MTPEEIIRHRLTSQQLTAPRFQTARDMLQWFGAVQGQEYEQSKWALGLRMPFLNSADLEKEFTNGSILRTHLLRPTWHFVAPEDIRWLLMLTAPRVNISNGHMYRKLGLDEHVFGRCNDILVKSLSGGKHLTRQELNNEFSKQNIKAEGHRLSYIMMRAELDGIICSGPRKGKQFTYALLDERVKQTPAKTMDEALAELTSRYFTSRGQATERDFSVWSGLTLSAYREGILMAENELRKEEFEGDTFYWVDGGSSPAKQPDRMHLLPIYDEMLLGYRQSRDLIFSDVNNRTPRATLPFDNMILHCGQVIGSWKRTDKESAIHLHYNLMNPLKRDAAVLFAEAVERSRQKRWF